jgi:hypothetical protein
MCATAACSQRLTPRSSGAACEEDRVLVTANVGDYPKLARARDVHPGIVLLEDGALPRTEQLRLLRVAAAAITQLGDLLNKFFWVAADGSMRVEDIPPP